ncbi:MAG: sulfotransferase domain-containing protein, partial [Flavobacteriaceae bacterium]
ASRLIAQIMSCPLVGDWGYEQIAAPYADGMNRKSDYQCFKSHHTYSEIQKVSQLKIHKIIYVIRDPRDIVISGSHYFSFSFSWLPTFPKRGLGRLPMRVLNKLVPLKEKRRQMIGAVLQGDSKINPWLKTPWARHYKGFQNRDILFISYEDLLTDPMEQSIRITDYLDTEVSRSHLRKSIEEQSFNRLKQVVNKQDDKQFKRLMRQGSKGYWQKEFSAEDRLKFKTVLLNDYEFYTF